MGTIAVRAGSHFLSTMVVIAILPLSLLADVPAPGTPNTDAKGTDWTFILLGAIAAFLGAILFLWIGRKLFKRS